MFTNGGKGNNPGLIKLLGLVFVVFGSTCRAAELKIQQRDKQLTLVAQPAKCVTLHQGRKCFAKIKFQWQSPIQGDFCLYQQQQGQVIRCWQGSRGNKLNFEFESSEKIAFEIRNQQNNKVVAATAVDVSWVHKAAPRKRRWRLF